MLKHKLLLLVMITSLLLSCGTAFAYYQGEGKDMGYWCTDCNKQHGPGETCPRQGGGYDDDDDGVVRVDPELQRQNEAVILNKDGNIYFNRGDYEMACKRYREALDKWPDDKTIQANYRRAKDKLDAKTKYDEEQKQYYEKMKPVWEKQAAEKKEKQRQKEFDAILFEAHQMPNFPIFGTTVVDLRDKRSLTVDINVVKGVDISSVSIEGAMKDPAEFRKDIFTDYSKAFHRRTQRSNDQAQEIIRSLWSKEPPSPVKNISQLAPGDVILVAPDVYYISSMINTVDRWASNNSGSPASHTATYLGEKNGKRWYLNNTPETGPVILEEKAFFEKYAERKMDVATLVGQPLNKHEGDELYKGAQELAGMGGYGIKALSALNGKDNMVCSEASRWLLLRAGRRVPETQDPLKKGIVKFSPSDFYEDQQYFIVHTLGMNK